MNRSASSLGLAGICLLLSNPSLATNGYFTHGIGSQIKGMAGAGIASDSDMGPIAVSNNPALGIFASDDMEVGLSFFSPRRSYKASSSLANGQGGAFTIGAGEIDSSNNLFPAPYFAKNWHLDEDHAVTFVTYGRGGMNTDWDSSTASASFDPDGPGPAPTSTSPGPYGGGTAGVDLSQLFLSINYAGRISEKFSWGFAPIFALQSFEAVGLRAFAPFTEAFAASSGTVMPNNLTNNGHDTSVGYGFTAGLWHAISDRLSVGIAYQSRMKMSDFDDYSDLFANGGGFDIPASTKGGLSYQTSGALRLNLDIEHTQFSEVDSVGNPMSLIGGCPSAGRGGTFPDNCLGGSAGAGFGWEDMTTYKLGAEWKLSDDLSWRFGFSYGEQPIQGEDAVFNMLAPGVIEYHLTAGVTIGRDNGDAFSVTAMFAPEKKVSGANLFDPTQTIELKMHQYEIEFSYRF